MSGMGIPAFRRTALSFALAALFSSHISYAQEVSINLATIEKLNVTAQKREQNIQQVPISISAVSADAIAKYALTDISDIADIVPNVYIDHLAPFGGSANVFSPSIRGIGQNEFAFNMEQGVGVYVDGVFYARPAGSVLDLLDLDRVEVLKGPQGTLFGRNTIGGAVSIVTRAPDTEYAFAGKIRLGNLHQQELRFSADIPLGERWLSQLAISTLSRDGYQKRIPYPADNAFVTDLFAFPPAQALSSASADTAGNKNQFNGRFKLQYQPTEVLTFTLTTDWTDTDTQAISFSLLGVDPQRPLSGAYNRCINTPVAALQASDFLGVCANRENVGSAFAGVNADNDVSNDRLPFSADFITDDPDLTFASGINYAFDESWGMTLSSNWQISSNLQLLSISAYRELEFGFGVNTSGTPFLFTQNQADADQRQLSQEFQLTGLAFNEQLEWVAGLYYFEEEAHMIESPVIGAGLIQPLRDFSNNNASTAIFTHLNLALSAQFSATLGARYSDEHKELDAAVGDNNFFSLRRGAPAAIYPNQDDLSQFYPTGPHEQDFTNTTLRAGLEYRPSDGMMLFASYSQGFKSGGWTVRVTRPAPKGIAPAFEPEEADTYELGIKTSLLEGNLQVNSTAFYTDYTNMQLTVVEDLQVLIKNAGESRISGIEIETQSLLSDHLYLTANYGYQKTEYRFLAEGAGFDIDNVFLNAPEHSAFSALHYYYPLGSGAELVFVGSWSFNSRIFNDTVNTLAASQPSTSLYHAAVTYVSPQSDWRVSVRGDNLTNERVLVGGYASANAGAILGSYDTPRLWSVMLEVSY